VRIKAAKEANPKRCYLFQQGKCTRENCSYVHEKPDAGKGGDRGGKAFSRPPEAKVQREKTANKNRVCSSCGRQGHHEGACRSRHGSGKVAIANAEEEVMARRCDGYMSSDDDLPVRASVLVVDDATTDEETIAKRSATITRWCVDSGANRDICSERQLFKGEMKAKTIRIGEAGQGHSFMSQGEGAIPLRVRGKALPLFARTIYAEQVSENIRARGGGPWICCALHQTWC